MMNCHRQSDICNNIFRTYVQHILCWINIEQSYLEILDIHWTDIGQNSNCMDANGSTQTRHCHDDREVNSRNSVHINLSVKPNLFYFQQFDKYCLWRRPVISSYFLLCPLFSVPLEVFRLPPSPDEEFGEEQPSVKYVQSAHTHGPAPSIQTQRYTLHSECAITTVFIVLIFHFYFSVYSKAFHVPVYYSDSMPVVHKLLVWTGFPGFIVEHLVKYSVQMMPVMTTTRYIN